MSTCQETYQAKWNWRLRTSTERKENDADCIRTFFVKDIKVEKISQRLGSPCTGYRLFQSCDNRKILPMLLHLLAISYLWYSQMSPFEKLNWIKQTYIYLKFGQVTNSIKPLVVLQVVQVNCRPDVVVFRVMRVQQVANPLSDTLCAWIH